MYKSKIKMKIDIFNRLQEIQFLYNKQLLSDLIRTNYLQIILQQLRMKWISCQNKLQAIKIKKLTFHLMAKNKVKIIYFK